MNTWRVEFVENQYRDDETHQAPDAWTEGGTLLLGTLHPSEEPVTVRLFAAGVWATCTREPS